MLVLPLGQAKDNGINAAYEDLSGTHANSYKAAGVMHKLESGAMGNTGARGESGQGRQVMNYDTNSAYEELSGTHARPHAYTASRMEKSGDGSLGPSGIQPMEPDAKAAPIATPTPIPTKATSAGA